MEKLITGYRPQMTTRLSMQAHSMQHSQTQFIIACFLLQALADNRPIALPDIHPDTTRDIEASLKFREAVRNLVRLYNNIEQSKINGLSPQLETLMQIRDEIIQHPNVRLHTVSYFAKRYTIGGSTLKRVFKQYFEITVHDFVTNECMLKARRLMENKALSISYIAEELGYADRSGFLRAYKKFNEKMIQ